MQEVKAQSKYIKTSVKKVQKIIDVVKGKKVEVALDTLKFMPQKAAAAVNKTLRSAMANATNNNNLDLDTMQVSNIIVDQGPSLKRFRARARGRGSKILKRTSHITVVISGK